ncbi:hypothetical protein [Rhodococcus sp. Q]|uniref:hypothetical protein n=1 Tax=Rhodococcus sp. Q TaxID=2502252 RepID=UPI0010F97FB7|nr:hypothetical protein [Rhodococcus sp. Q]
MTVRSLALSVLCAAALAVAAAPPVQALPAPARQDESLPFPSVGVPPALTFSGRTDDVTLQIPVPQGLSPVALRGTLQVPAGSGQGWIDVLSDGRTLGRVDVPSGAPTVPVSLPLTGASIVGNTARITLRSYLVPLDDQWCSYDWSEGSLAIVNGVVDFAGTEAQPTVLADFLPPALTRLSVYVPPEPSREEVAAALEIGAAITARYANQDAAVDLRALPAGQDLPTDPAGLLERQVVVSESDVNATTLSTSPAGVPVLTLSGSGDGLLNQSRLLTSDLAAVTVATTAIAGSLDAAPAAAQSLTTLGDLGASALTATSTGRVQVRVGIDQTRLGQPSGPVRVHLIGNYTPLPDTQNGQITVTVGDTTLDQWPVDEDGRIDRWVEIPSNLMSRYTELVVTLQVAGAMACGSTQPVTLTLDPDGAVRSEVQVPPHPSGFQALPQGLMPIARVGLQEDTFDDARRAMSIVTGMQGLTVTPFRPVLVDFDDAVNSDVPAILVAANGGLPDSVPLPLKVTGDDTVELVDLTGDGEPERVDVPGLQFGSLQAAWDAERDRMLLVATSTGTPESVDRILAWLDADRSRWSSLSGDALFQTGDRDPVQVTAKQPAPETDETSDVVRGVLIAGGVLILVGLLVAAAVAIGLRRRSQR